MKFQIGYEIINSYRRLAYTPWHALAEFVDNPTPAHFADNRGGRGRPGRGRGRFRCVHPHDRTRAPSR